ncbi:murein biosynthesis integral membrane protein MurJ [Cellulomonas fimi]|uniref:Integral membrane protein MviN n=1 Tax=Cellulomonas fimi (strain ATCC 484 / DSM 20113 / JCM 1341 / CCUG 24087 / LMG 16345 / NBRC 15513 / NCIMB 8980 / NCTC 7547 / NRS-133) TaxID=590998 RepID=F4H651_CELFA|nr:murein biosynthesis integral membrane protein MurJ [Cellulomonas fimi]AEE47901.1 integral membrane protein MviN [Cellulomonas fimi ATCC 484]NNH09053.1 murein biosynthesis integral membrane protein MurJ [Cellulomonas fimi]VEH37104.1 integral membrane protein MviN [Cellulomonas fimi]
MTSPSGVRRGAALMASGTAVSRVLGLLRGIVLVAAIGATGQAADAFDVANKLPNVLYMLLAGGVLNAILVPQVVRAYKREAGQEYVDRLLTLGFVMLAGVSLVLTVAAPLLVHLYAADVPPSQATLATTFAYWCIPQLFFYGVYALLGQVLNARGSFGPYMWAPVVNNVVAIAGFGVFVVVFGSAQQTDVATAATWTSGQVALLAGASTAGVVAQALVLVPALRRAGVGYRPRWGLRGSGLGRAGQVATWTFVGLVVGQLGFIVVSRAAAAAPHAADGGVVAGNAAYTAAFLVFMLPHSLVTVSLATALFTRLSGQAHDEDADGVRATFSYGVRVVGLFTIAAAALLFVLSRPVTGIVLMTADRESVEVVALVVQAMVVGLPAFGAWSMAQRVFYAYEDARGMVPIQVAMAVVVAGGTLLAQAFLPPRSWVVGAALAMSVSYVVGAVAAAWLLRRRIGGVDGPRILRLHVRATLAVLPAVAVAATATRVLALALPDGLLRAVVTCVVAGGLGGAVYVGALRLLRVEELDGMLRPVLARLRGARR